MPTILSELALDLYELGFPPALLKLELMHAMHEGTVPELSLLIESDEVVAATLQGVRVATAMPLRRITMPDIVEGKQFKALRLLYETYGASLGDRVASRLRNIPIGYSEKGIESPGRRGDFVCDWAGARVMGKVGYYYAFLQNEHGRQLVMWDAADGYLTGLSAAEVRRITRQMAEPEYVIGSGDVSIPLPDIQSQSGEWIIRRSKFSLQSAKFTRVHVYVLSHISGLHFILGKIGRDNSQSVIAMERDPFAIVNGASTEIVDIELLMAEDELRRFAEESTRRERDDEWGGPFANPTPAGDRRNPQMTVPEILNRMANLRILGPELFARLKRKHGYHEIHSDKRGSSDHEESLERAIERYVRSRKRQKTSDVVAMPLRFTVDLPQGMDVKSRFASIFDQLHYVQHPAFQEAIFMGFKV